MRRRTDALDQDQGAQNPASTWRRRPNRRGGTKGGRKAVENTSISSCPILPSRDSQKKTLAIQSADKISQGQRSGMPFAAEEADLVPKALYGRVAEPLDVAHSPALGCQHLARSCPILPVKT